VLAGPEHGRTIPLTAIRHPMRSPPIVQHIVGTRVAVASRYRAAILIFDESNREGSANLK
jgi:hypothetical protein